MRQALMQGGLYRLRLYHGGNCWFNARFSAMEKDLPNIWQVFFCGTSHRMKPAGSGRRPAKGYC